MMPVRILLACAILASLALPAHPQTGASVDESSGSARYVLPLLVPPGNAGHQPELALQYDSGRARGAAGWIGIGWKLTAQSAIRRSTSHGVPYDYAGALACTAAAGGPAHLCYAERFALDGEELVPVGPEAGGTRQRYRTRRDDGRRIQRVLALDRWEIRDRAGNLRVYGSSGASQVRNPKNGQVFAWHLASETDPWGNWLRYEYTAGDGVLYPAAISYSFATPGLDPHQPEAQLVPTRRISFELDGAESGARPDVALDYGAGFRQAVTRRLARIDVWAGSPVLQLVTRYRLDYGQEPHSDRSRLVRVTRQAPSQPGLRSLPPHEFDYTETTPGFAGAPQTDFASSTDLERRAPASLSGPNGLGDSQQTRRLIDLNGDALVDLYDWAAAAPAVPGRAYLNDGARLRGAIPWAPAPAGEPGYWWMKPLRLEVASSSNTRSLAIEMLDVNGDGLPDVASDGASIARPPLEVRLGSAGGLRGDVKLVDGWAWPGEIEQIGVDLSNGESHPTRLIQGLIDVTGDGRADLFWRRTQGSSFGFAPALGTDPELLAYRPGSLTWPKPSQALPLLSDVFAGHMPPLFYVLAVEMYDVNGDGLVDHVGAHNAGPAVSYNYGAGFELPAYHAEHPRFAASGTRLGPTPSGLMCGDGVSVDINGDGCVDSVFRGGEPWDLWVHFGTCDGRYAADPSRPYGIAEPTHWPSVLPNGDCAFEPAQLVDVNGDGMVDYVHDLDTIYLNPGQAPGLLTRIVTPTGGVAEFEYAAAADQASVDGPASPDLPMPRWVVRQLVLRDSGSATPIAERFEFAGADYDRVEREFRGFARVRRARMNGAAEHSVVVRTYASGALGRACMGRVLSEEISGGELLRRTLHSYDASRGGTGTDGARWEKCLRLESRVEHLEGGGEAGKRVVRSEYHWQAGDPFNLLSQTDWGEQPPGSTADEAGDASHTAFEYLPAEAVGPTDPYWVSTLVRRRVVDPPGTTEPRTYSDVSYAYADPCEPAAPVRAVPGRPARVEAWLDRPEPRWVALQRTCRDAHGNPTVVLGPATPSAPGGAYQRTDYETTFWTFPARLTRGDAGAGQPSLVTRFVYGHEPGSDCSPARPAPAGLGLACREISPGGLPLASGYDEFGRIERIEEASGVVTAIAHELPADPRSAAGTLVTTSVSSREGSFASRARHDGLGRLVQTETPGAASVAETIYVQRRYDHAGRVSAVSRPSAVPPDADTRFTLLEYDALDRLTLRADPDGDTQLRTRFAPLVRSDRVYFGSEEQTHERREFDGLGRLAWLETSAGGARRLRTRLLHDPAGRLVRIEDPIRGDPALCLPSAEQPFDLGPSCGAAGRHETRIEYDSLGRRVLLSDPDAGTTRFQYDDAGQVTRVDRAEGSAAAHASTFAYDALGRVTRRGFSALPGAASGVSDALLTYHTSGAANGLLQRVDAERPDGTDYTYLHDSLGRLVQVEQVTDSLRFVTHHAYDSLGRPVRTVLPDGSAKLYTYDGARLRSAGLVKGIRWDALGRPTDYFSGYVRFHYGFDPATARLARIRASRGAGSGADFMALELDFDGLGRSTALQGSVDGRAIARSFGYDGAGRLVEATGEWERPLGIERAVHWQFQYDPLGNPRRQSSEGGTGASERSWDYAHATRPRALTHFAERRGGETSHEQVWVDDAGRTDGVLRLGAGGVAWRDYRWNAQGRFQGIDGLQPGYAYDVFGARVMQKSGSGAAARRVIYVGDDFEYNDFDRWANTLHRLEGEIVASSGRAWSAPRLAGSGGGALPWLALLGGPALLLAFVRLRSRRAALPAWARSGAVGGLVIGLVVAPVPLGASPPAPDAPGSHGTHRADLLVYVRDHLGSVRLVVDYPQANVVERRDYGPFGEPLEHRGAFDLQHQYTGQRRDAALDLEFFGARMYDRRWGRFVSPDPIAAGFGPDQLNRYAYARNRPTSLRDPTGLDARAAAKNHAELVGPHVGETITITASPTGGIDLGSQVLPPDMTFTLDIQFALASALDVAALQAALDGTPRVGQVPAPREPLGADIETIEVHGEALPPDFPRAPVVFLAWRPIRLAGIPVAWHGFLAIWDPATREIYRQFSLTAPERTFDREGDSDTYAADRRAFENPGGRNLVFPITPPGDLGGREFAAGVYEQALSLELPGDYSLVGPYNSNWAATHPLKELGAAYAIPNGLAPGAIPHGP